MKSRYTIGTSLAIGLVVVGHTKNAEATLTADMAAQAQAMATTAGLLATASAAPNQNALSLVYEAQYTNQTVAVIGGMLASVSTQQALSIENGQGYGVGAVGFGGSVDEQVLSELNTVANGPAGPAALFASIQSSQIQAIQANNTVQAAMSAALHGSDTATLSDLGLLMEDDAYNAGYEALNEGVDQEEVDEEELAEAIDEEATVDQDEVSEAAAVEAEESPGVDENEVEEEAIEAAAQAEEMAGVDQDEVDEEAAEEAAETASTGDDGSNSSSSGGDDSSGCGGDSSGCGGDSSGCGSGCGGGGCGSGCGGGGCGSSCGCGS